MAFENIVRSLDAIMDIVKKLQSLVSSKTFILYRSLLGLENWVKWAWQWNWRSKDGNDTS